LRRRERRIVTPEQVAIRLTPAGPASRLAALLLDTALVVAASGLLAAVLEQLLPRALSGLFLASLLFVVHWGYHVYFETRHRGRSPGKRAAGLRVVDGRGLAITVEQSFVRNILRALDFLPFYYGIGGIACLLDPDGRRLGDIAADTLVVAERPPASALDRPSFGGQDRRLDDLGAPDVARRIRHRIGAEERELLAALCRRADRLEAKARYDLMEEVAAYYREKLEIDAPHLSGENLVRGIAAVVFPRREVG
jgi:uncharacterized RDD family membrane protein YckC